MYKKKKSKVIFLVNRIKKKRDLKSRKHKKKCKKKTEFDFLPVFVETINDDFERGRFRAGVSIFTSSVGSALRDKLPLFAITVES